MRNHNTLAIAALIAAAFASPALADDLQAAHEHYKLQRYCFDNHQENIGDPIYAGVLEEAKQQFKDTLEAPQPPPLTPEQIEQQRAAADYHKWETANLPAVEACESKGLQLSRETMQCGPPPATPIPGSSKLVGAPPPDVQKEREAKDAARKKQSAENVRLNNEEYRQRRQQEKDYERRKLEQVLGWH
jgi:hypothetical protein